MSAIHVREIVAAYVDAMNRRDEAAFFAVTTEDFQFQMMARSPEWLGVTLDRQTVAKQSALLSQFMHEPFRIDIVNIVVEGDRAAVEAVADCRMLNGMRYRNAYHFAFRIVGDKVAEMREYGCSHSVVTCFPEMTPPNV